MDASKKSLLRLLVIVDKERRAAEGIPDGDLERVDGQRLLEALDRLLGPMLVEMIVAQSPHCAGAFAAGQRPGFLVVGRI